MQNFGEKIMVVGAGGPVALRTSPQMGEDGTGVEISDFCCVWSVWGRQADLL